MLFSIINEGGESKETQDAFFVVSESDFNNDNINKLLNPEASFNYTQEKNNIIFLIENFAEEEFEYYSIITLYNNTEDLSNFCFFNEFFKNNKSSFSQSLSKGKGKNSITTITHNINEDCYSYNCTIMIFAKSSEKNLSKIYTPKIINILENHKEESYLMMIIIASSIVIGLIIIIIIIICIIEINRKKKYLNDKTNSFYGKYSIFDKIKLEKELEINSSDSIEELIDEKRKELDKNNNNLNINNEEENSLPSEGEILRRKTNSTVGNKDAPPNVGGFY